MSEENSCNVEDITLSCADGIHIAAQRWTLQDGHPSNDTTSTPAAEQRILCLHGWLDNCRSYYRLAPLILTQLSQQVQKEGGEVVNKTTIVAIDFPGHGLSSHKSIDGPTTVLSENAYYVAEVVAQLGWDTNSSSSSSSLGAKSDNESQEQQPKFTLIGHSMGCAVSIVYTACYPENVSNLILLEGFGPRPRPDKDITQSIRKHITTRMKSIRKPKPKSIFPNVDTAVQARCMTATTFPGKQYISTEAAYELVLRATVKPADSKEDDDTSVQFVHDNRLYWPSLQYMTTEQNITFYKDIREAEHIDVCILTGKDGWPFDLTKENNHMKVALDTLQPKVMKELPGSHHFHMDPESCEEVARNVVEFLTA